MFKFIVPAIIIFLIILFWEKICVTMYKKFKIRLNYLVVSIILLGLTIIILLIKN
jgi:hypothetical protein